MRPSTTSRHTSSGTHYSPSVPISVYRELAAQLQATEAKLDSLNAENYALAKQNQQLRQEIEKAVHSVMKLQQIVDSTQLYSRNHHTNQQASAQSVHRRKKVIKTPVIDLPLKQSGTPLHTEQEDGRYRRRLSATASEVNGWGLAIAILLIIVSAFGAGYLIVGPLRSNR
jgi:ABC-type transporter Mla subunit MlaD